MVESAIGFVVGLIRNWQITPVQMAVGFALFIAGGLFGVLWLYDELERRLRRRMLLRRLERMTLLYADPAHVPSQSRRAVPGKARGPARLAHAGSTRGAHRGAVGHVGASAPDTDGESVHGAVHLAPVGRGLSHSA